MMVHAIAWQSCSAQCLILVSGKNWTIWHNLEDISHFHLEFNLLYKSCFLTGRYVTRKSFFSPQGLEFIKSSVKHL